MGIFIAVVGALDALVAAFLALLPQPADSAAVQELRIISGSLGVIIFALGVIIHRLPRARRARPSSAPTEAVTAPEPSGGEPIEDTIRRGRREGRSKDL